MSQSTRWGSQPLDLSFSEEENQVLALAHRFAEEVLRPSGIILDKVVDPADVIAKDSLLWEVFDRYEQLGLSGARWASGDVEPAVLAHRARLGSAVSEELAWGDVGLAISVGLTSFAHPYIAMTGNKELAERYSAPGVRTIGCWALTEPDHGSDTVGFSEAAFRDPSIRANCVARRDGSDYVISGQKAAWVSNGSIADIILVFCTLEGDKGFAGGAGFVVPAELPGVHRPRPLDKLGQRTLNQGEIFFQDVRVPADHMVYSPEAYPAALEDKLATANAGMASLFVGVGRAAYDLALDYAKQRVQGGRPIIEHQNVKSRLFKMFAQLEAARSLARRVAEFNAVSTPRIELSIAAKTFSTNTAFEVASAAVQIFGGYGLSREYPIEKVLRDARASMIEDGCNEMLGIVGASKL